MRPLGRHRGFTPDEVREIRQRHARGETIVSIAHSFDVTASPISSIVRGLGYRHVTDVGVEQRRYHRHFTDAEIRNIRRRAQYEDMSTLALEYGVAPTMIAQIKGRKVYRKVPDLEVSKGKAKTTTGGFRVGDVVRIRSGSPDLVVQGSSAEGILVVACWTSSGLRTHEVTADLLELVRREEPHAERFVRYGDDVGVGRRSQ